MSIRLELLRRGTVENMKRSIEEYENAANKTTETIALDMLYEIYKILCNKEYNDTEAVIKIAHVFEENFESSDK